MKHSFSYLIATAMAVTLFAIAPIPAAGQITLNFQHAGIVTIGLAGSDKATIDWGDGTPLETHSLKFGVIPVSHNYSGATPRTITITGGKIRGLVCTDMGITNLDVSTVATLSILDCSRNRLTNIDVSKNLDLRHLTCTHNQLTTIDVSQITWIAHIRCSFNQITSLDISKNVAMKNLYCDHNQLDANALNNFFRTLHKNTINGGKAIFIADNPGFAGANTALARESGWTIGGLTN